MVKGQGSVYIRCLEPLEDEDKDEEDEQLMTPAYHLCSDDLTENPAEKSSSTSQKQDDEAVGRILVKGYTESQYFQHKISWAFLAVCLFGEGSITREMLQDSFKRYVSQSETKLTEGCLANTIACDSEEMLDFLSTFDCKRKVVPGNVAATMS